MAKAKGRRVAKKAEKKPVKKVEKEEEEDVEVEIDRAEDSETEAGENEKNGADKSDAEEEDEEDEPKAKRGRPSATKSKKPPAKKGKGAAKGKKKGPAPKKPVTKKTDESEEDEEDSETEYEVDRILDVRYHKNKPREFEVKWKGYSVKDSTWEPETNLTCPELVKAFMKKCDGDNLPRTGRLRINTIQNTLATRSALNTRTNTKNGRLSQTEAQVSSQRPSSSQNNNSNEVTFATRKRNLLKRLVPGVAAASCIGSIGYLYVSNPNLFSWESVNHFVQPLYKNADNLFRKVLAENSNS